MQFTFYKNDGTSTSTTLTTSVASITAPSITDVGDSHVDWTRTGFNFVEWNSNSTGSGTSYAPNDTVSLKNISYLYAIWEENHEITVTYKGATVTSLDASGNITLGTAGKYCEGNILIEYDRPSAPSPVLQSRTASYTPSTSQQSETITAESGYDGLSSVSVTVDAMPTGSVTIPATTITATPSISVDSSGLISTSVSTSATVVANVTAGYVSTGTSRAITVNGSNTSQLSTQAATTITPTESEQTAVASGKYTTGIVKVGAISSTYVGSGITQRSSSDLTVSGATVTAPSGYYSTSASASVASGTEGTPTATKGTVSNHSISVTPSVTNSVGYITGGTKTGTAISVSASELVSGTLSVNSSGTKDVTNYASVSIPSGSAKVPNTSYSPSITISVDDETGEIQASGYSSYTLAPTVTAGYVSSGTSGTISVDVWDMYQLPVYDGEHHQPPILTISLTNPVNSSYFDSCEIYDETSGETKIGEITSATGSVSLDLTDRFAWWDVSTLSIGIVFSYKSGGFLHYETSGISCTGDVSFDYGGGSGNSFFTVTGTGTIVIDGVDYNYGA